MKTSLYYFQIPLLFAGPHLFALRLPHGRVLSCTRSFGLQPPSRLLARAIPAAVAVFGLRLRWLETSARLRASRPALFGAGVVRYEHSRPLRGGAFDGLRASLTPVRFFYFGNKKKESENCVFSRTMYSLSLIHI